MVAAPAPESGVARVAKDVGSPSVGDVAVVAAEKCVRQWRGVAVVMLAGHSFGQAASPSSDGRMEDVFTALPETISWVIAKSLSGAVVVCVQATASGIVDVVR